MSNNPSSSSSSSSQQAAQAESAVDLVPGKEWRDSLNATCNRLSTQYLQLLKAAAASKAALSEQAAASSGSGVGATVTGAGGGNAAAGGGTQTTLMSSLQDPPPPALAAEVLQSQLMCQLATENLCVAASQLLTLIRQLRLSILITDTSTISAEEIQACEEILQQTHVAQQQATNLEQEWIQLRNNNK